MNVCLTAKRIYKFLINIGMGIGIDISIGIGIDIDINICKDIGANIVD